MTRLRPASKRGSEGRGGSMFGAILLSALLLLSGVLFWNTAKLHQSSMINQTALGKANSFTGVAPGCSSTNPTSETTVAFEQSLGFFDDINDQEWIELFQKPARAAEHYKNKGNPNFNSIQASFWNFLNQEPVMSCPHLKKVGGLGDGPKWTCDPERLTRVVQRRKAANPASKESQCLVYSIGSNGDYVFEDGLYDLLGPICEIHIFDFDPFSREDGAEKNIHYHQWGLTSSYSKLYKPPPGKLLYTFQEIKKKLGHEHRAVDIFKIDCEGCEWHTWKDWIKEDIRQILIETHELPLQNQIRPTNDFGLLPKMGANKYFDAFEENGFVMFAKEINSPNWNNNIGGRCSEWSYIKMAPEFLDMKSPASVQKHNVGSGPIEVYA
jgi:hypothetical protein